MSTANLIRKPLPFDRRARLVRSSWSTQERSRRAQMASQRLTDLVTQIISGGPPEDVWAVGSLAPADLRRLSA